MSNSDRFWEKLPSVRRIGRCLKRPLKWGVIGILILLILGTITWTTMNVVGSSRLEKKKAELAAAGFAVIPEALAPPPISVEENGAPYYQAAMALVVDLDDLRMEDPYTKITAQDMAKIPAWVARNKSALDLVRQGRQRPRCQFERNYEQGFSMLLPEVTGALKLSKILSLKARWDTSEGRHEEARECVRDILVLADSLEEDALLVSALVTLVIVGFAQETVDQCVRGDLDPADLREWLEVLPASKHYDRSLERGFRGDMVIALHSITSDPFPLCEEICLPTYLVRPFLKLGAVYYLDLMCRAVEIDRKPSTEALVEIRRLDHEVQGAEPRWFYPAVYLLMPAVRKAVESRVTLQAQLVVARAGLEWEIAYAQNGRYPEKIETPDPFTGKPLILKDGRIASVGRDGKEEISEGDPVWVLRHKT